MDFKIIHSDCMDAMLDLITKGIQVDSIVTDPPYGIRFMGMAWDGKDIEEMAKKAGNSALHLSAINASAGTYDRSSAAMAEFQYWSKEWAKLAIQLLKPGGHLLCFASPRTYHRMASGIEDAGFEIRDQLMWIFGQGFPKSLDISKAIDKAAGVEREIVGYDDFLAKKLGQNCDPVSKLKKEINEQGSAPITAPSTDAAKQWQGFGTALKPSHEPLVLARKPLSEKTIAANVLKHGTGAINIDGCRVGPLSQADAKHRQSAWSNHEESKTFNGQKYQDLSGALAPTGRFPANLIHDGSDEVEEEFAKYGERKSGHVKPLSTKKQNKIFGEYKEANINEFLPNSGTASRFFYCAKASKKDRNGSKHPTVKPIALMRYLCRLITPPGGIVLDPFAGSGTTGRAAIDEGFNCILIEKDPTYITDINNRFNLIKGEINGSVC